MILQGDASSSWDTFQAGAPQLAGSADAGPEDLRQRFAALVAYQQGADVDAHPVQHIDRLLQVCRLAAVPWQNTQYPQTPAGRGHQRLMVLHSIKAGMVMPALLSKQPL